MLTLLRVPFSAEAMRLWRTPAEAFGPGTSMPNSHAEFDERQAASQISHSLTWRRESESAERVCRDGLEARERLAAPVAETRDVTACCSRPSRPRPGEPL